VAIGAPPRKFWIKSPAAPRNVTDPYVYQVAEEAIELPDYPLPARMLNELDTAPKHLGFLPLGGRDQPARPGLVQAALAGRHDVGACRDQR
jgi:hypothetical protein